MFWGAGAERPGWLVRCLEEFARRDINLTKIAGYRALLGMDEREMEEKQGVKFIRVASSRGIEIPGLGADDFDASPIDLISLEKMDFDLRLRPTPGFVP